MKMKNSAKNGGSSKRAQVKFKTNENVKIFATDNDYEEEEEEELEEVEDEEEEKEEEEAEEAEENESDGSEIDEDTNESMHNAESTSNTGWANVMQKILKTNKPKGKKTMILSKAKKLCDIKMKEKKEDTSFEIDGIEEKKTDLKVANVKTVEHTDKQIKQREKILGIRVKPSITDQERERMLQKIATKGVVQLFNAVKQQQIEINKKISQVGSLERKREQVLKNIDKNAFLDVLMGGSKSISVDNSIKSNETVKKNTIQNKDENKIWSVLRDDFVMGAKLKDWDKRDAEQEESSASDMDCDDDDK